MAVNTAIFKDYDIRGIYPSQLNGEVARELAYAVYRKFAPKTVAIVRDMRLSGEELRDGLSDVLTRLGVDVFDAGLGGTEIAYFIAGTRPYDLVIMISASHNPPEYNGLKMVLKGPHPVTTDGLNAVKSLLSEGPLPDAPKKGTLSTIDVFDEWRKKVLSLVDTRTFKPLSVVIDAGNGMGGVLAQKIFAGLPFSVTPLYFEPDGHFPNHTPNPLIEENNRDLIAKIKETGANVGLTFDGDADRMFLVDDTGRLVSGTITTALLSRYILEKHPGEMILYNAICGRIVPQIIEKYGGKSKRVRVGHSFLKASMRETNAIFAGEHSGHYYHRDFFFAESGVLTALMVLSLLSHQEKKLSQLVDELDVYPASGEMNFTVADIPSAITKLKTSFPDAKSIDELDGLSVWYPDHWFNFRASKTEPLLRLNVEADSRKLTDEVTQKLVALMTSMGAKRK